MQHRLSDNDFGLLSILFHRESFRTLKLCLNRRIFANFQLFFSYQIQKTMFPINQMQCRYFSLLLLNQMFNNQRDIYPNQRDFPQMGNQNVKTPETSPAFQQTDSKISDERPQKTQKTETKQSLGQFEQKRSTQPSKSEIIEKNDSQKLKKKQPVKPKRPQNYLTERAFYMKQKLKSKQRADKRILRRRPKEKGKSTIKVALRSVEQKKKNQVAKTSSKNKMIKKQSCPQKQKKNYQKLQQKIVKQYMETAATIPKKIQGIWQVNQFCRIKLESLLKRRVLL